MGRLDEFLKNGHAKKNGHAAENKNGHSSEGWHVLPDDPDLKLRVTRTGGRLAIVEVRHGEAIVHRDTLNVDLWTKRGEFNEQVKKRVPSVNRDALEIKLLELASQQGRAGQFNDRLPKICLEVGEDGRILGEMTKAIAESGIAIYQRGDVLVRVMRPAKVEGDWEKSLEIKPVEEALLGAWLTDSACFVKAGEKGEAKAILPPRLIKAFSQCAPWDGIRVLTAVVESPIVRPDGTILQDPGYDGQTGIFYSPRATFPRIGVSPTLADAEAAARLLLDLVQDFPFLSEEHKSAWLAGLLTLLGRHAYQGNAPLFLIDANTPGTGKGLLVDVIAMIFRGDKVGPMACPTGEEEGHKTNLSLALSGTPVVLLDNIAGELGAPWLDMMLTSTVYQGRVMKTHQIARVPHVVTFFATGNNVRLRADTVRRVMHVRLESHDEHPEDRTDFREKALLTHVQERRAKFLEAGLTILSAYIRAGKPQPTPLPSWGSFEEWSALIRGAIVWCGLADPLAANRRLRETADDDAAGRSLLIAGWEELEQHSVKQGGLTVRDALVLLEPLGSDKCTLLREAFGEVFKLKVGEQPDPGQLGKFLSKMEGRPIDGKVLRKRSVGKRNRWTVLPSNAPISDKSEITPQNPSNPSRC